jgi:histidinol-phosphate aminotransferase
MARYDPGPHATGERWLCLHRNENLFVDREWYEQALSRVAKRHPMSVYPDPSSAELREALARHHGVSPASIYVGNGSDGVLADLMCYWRKRYDRLATRRVSYRVYPVLAERYGYTIEDLDAPHDDMGEAATGGRLIALDSPDAITGSRAPSVARQTLRAEPESFLIWDNVYGDFDGEEPDPVVANQVTVRSFSKFYGLSSLRVGYCLADPELVADICALKDVFNVNGVAQAMALEALLEHERFASLAQEMRACREALVEALRKRDFAVTEVSGNFVFARPVSISAVTLQERLRDDHSILVRHFPGTDAADGVRITVPRHDGLDQFLEGLDQVVEGMVV